MEHDPPVDVPEGVKAVVRAFPGRTVGGRPRHTYDLWLVDQQRWGDLRPGQFYACSDPERPHVEHATQYDLRCHRCRIAARATLATAGDFEIPFHDVVTGTDEPMWLSVALALAEGRYERGVSPCPA